MLARLRTARPELETWTEQLRAWLAADLLQLLVRLLNGTHKVGICKLRRFMFLVTPVGKPDLRTLRRACRGASMPTAFMSASLHSVFVQAEPVCGSCACSTRGLADCCCMAGR